MRRLNLYLQTEDEDGCDYIVEVKNQESPVSNKEIRKFINEKNILKDRLNKKTGFIFYSVNGVTKDQKKKLRAKGIMVAKIENR